MSETTYIRGPYPSQKVISGNQSFYVDERISPALKVSRKVVFTKELDKVISASCTCTLKATLKSPCTHIQKVLEYIRKTNPASKVVKQQRNSYIVQSTSRTVKPISSSASIPTGECSNSPEEINNISQIGYVVKAVQHEILAIQTSQNVRQVLITNGKLIGSIGESFRYKFDLSDEFRSPAETPIELHVANLNSLPIPGTILRCEPENFIEIALDGFHGEIILEAKLISRLDFIWKAAEKRLTELNESPNLEILKTFLNPEKTYCFENELEENWGEFKPDKEQKSALAKSIGQKVTFVYGPPGTGKSQTIGWLVKEFIRRDEKILIASHTNIAVDNALQKACETEEGNALRKAGDVIRLGEPLNQDLDDLRVHNVIKKKSAGLQEKQTNLKEMLVNSQNELNTYQEEIKILERFQNAHIDRTKLIQDLSSLESTTSRTILKQEALKAKLNILEKQLKSRDLLDLVFWVFRRAQASDAKTTIAKFETYLKSLSTRRETLQQKIVDVENFLEQNNISTNTEVYSNEIKQLRDKESKINLAINELSTESDSIQEKLDEIAKNIYSQAKVIGVTLSKLAIDSSLIKFQPENLIIDELSTSPFPLVLVALMLPSRRAILFGDPNQLPPICIADSDCAKLYLKRDTYEIIPRHKEVSTELTVQRRMPESIVEFVNSAIYDNKLSTAPDIAKNRNSEILEGDKSLFRNPPFKDHQVIYVDTSSINPWCARDSNQSKYNLYSAHIVSEIIAQEIDSRSESKEKKVGVICPYRAQKQLIKKLCQARLGLTELPSYLDVHTVDAFQGEQRDIIILDLTAGQPSRPGIRLSEKIEKEILGIRGVSKVRRLLNVAITRTKYQLVILANKKYFEREFKDSPKEYVWEIIQRASGDKGKKDLLKSHVWIDGEDLLRGQAKTQSGYSPFLDENNFYQYLKQDFEKAIKSVIIVSPFITWNRVQDVKPNISNMLQRGVRIQIITRPVEDAEFGVSALQSLQQLGCIVHQRKRTHEKVVIIDNKIAYYGSLNVLSHKNTKEMMHRIQGEQVSQLLQQFINVIGVEKRSNIPTARATNQSLTREECSGKLKHLRWTIASQRHIPQYAVLYNKTIEELLNNPPQTEEELYDLLQECGEKQMTHLSKFLDEILALLRIYRP